MRAQVGRAYGLGTVALVIVAAMGLFLHQNCGKLTPTATGESGLSDGYLEATEEASNMIAVRDGVELQLLPPSLRETRTMVGGPIVGYTLAHRGSSKYVGPGATSEEMSLNYSVTFGGETGTVPLPSCMGRVMTSRSEYNFECTYGLSALRSNFPNKEFAIAWIVVTTYPKGGEGDPNRKVQATAIARIPLNDEVLFGDTNNNSVIDPGETGNVMQGYRCAIFVNGAPANLRPWQYDAATGVYFSAAGGYGGYRCLPKTCVGNGEWQALSPTYPCCEQLVQSSDRRCIRPSGSGVLGDANGNSVIDGDETGSFSQAKLGGFRCGNGTIPRFRANMRAYPTQVGDFFKAASADLGYRCVPGVRGANLGEGDIYGAGYNLRLADTPPTGLRFDASDLLETEALYNGCGAGTVQRARSFQDNPNEGRHYVCERSTGNTLIGDRDGNGKITVWYRNVFQPSEFNPEIGALSQGNNCGNDASGRKGFPWPYDYNSLTFFKAQGGENGYMCRSADENCVPDGGYHSQMSGINCCPGLTLVNSYICAASRLERLRTIVGGANVQQNWDQWAFHYRRLTGAVPVPEFTQLFPGIGGDVRARLMLAERFLECVESNQCGALRTLYGLTGTSTSSSTTTSTLPLADRMNQASNGTCNGNCSWDQWNLFYTRLTLVSVLGPESYFPVSPDRRARLITVVPYLDCVSRNQCAAAASLYAAGASTTTTTMGQTTTTQPGQPTTTTMQTTTTTAAASLRDRVRTRSGNAAVLTWDQWNYYYNLEAGMPGPAPDAFFDVDNVKRMSCSGGSGAGCMSVDVWYNCAIATQHDCAAAQSLIGQ